jgi:hypothetical protein
VTTLVLLMVPPSLSNISLATSPNLAMLVKILTRQRRTVAEKAIGKSSELTCVVIVADLHLSVYVLASTFFFYHIS